jgi:hypothetical protein
MADPPSDARQITISSGRADLSHTLEKARSFPLRSLDIIIVASSEAHPIRIEVGVGVVVPKSKTQVSTDLRDKADRVDALAHALADYFGRKVVVVRTNDKEEVVEPRAKRRLDC